jgi:hypothetical protein
MSSNVSHTLTRTSSTDNASAEDKSAVSFNTNRSWIGDGPSAHALNLSIDSLESVESGEFFMAVNAAADATMEALDVPPFIANMLGLLDNTSE